MTDDGMFRDMDGDPLELKVTAAKRVPKKGWKRYYVRVPDVWRRGLLNAKQLGTYRLAHELLYERWRIDHDLYCTRGDPIVVAGAIGKTAKLTERSRRSALVELEKLGLITIARKPGQAPRVKLRHWPKDR